MIVHGTVLELQLVDKVESCVENVGIQLASRLREAGLTIAALLAGPKVDLEKRSVSCGDNGEVIRHVVWAKSRGSDLSC